jgi:hypothetical protein
MTANDFRRLALSFPDTEERAHMHHPDFRVAGKIFATLGYPDDGWAMVKLTPLEQEMFVKAQPAVFNPCTGVWGRRGATGVRLKSARKPTLRRALEAAWRLAAPETLARQYDERR